MYRHHTIASPPLEPKSFCGFVETTVQALRLVHAARQGVIPRITRRLNDVERRSMIKSGAVFVFDVKESGIKRWTEGLVWSPSRIVGNFLVYREVHIKPNNRRGRQNRIGTPSGALIPVDEAYDESLHTSVSIAARMSANDTDSNECVWKENGLIKKTITVTVEGSDLHLVAYYNKEDLDAGRLKRVTNRPDIMALDLPPEIFRLTNFRHPPKVETGLQGRLKFIESEAEQMDYLQYPDERATGSSTPSRNPSSSPRSDSSDFEMSGHIVANDVESRLQHPGGPTTRQHEPHRPYSFWSSMRPSRGNDRHENISQLALDIPYSSPRPNHTWSAFSSPSYSEQISSPQSEPVMHSPHLHDSYSPVSSLPVIHQGSVNGRLPPVMTGSAGLYDGQGYRRSDPIVNSAPWCPPVSSDADQRGSARQDSIYHLTGSPIPYKDYET